MYWLVENKEQLDVLINSGYKEAFIEVIPYNDILHPSQTYVSLVYIKPLEATKGFMVGIHHSEITNELITCKTKVVDLINKFEKLYCRDKKEILHYFPIKTLYDITPPPTTYLQKVLRLRQIVPLKKKFKL